MRILRGTVVGSVLFFFVGWLVWGVVLNNYMTDHMNSAVTRSSDEMVWWAIIISQVALGLMATVVLNWAGAKNATDGLRIGAILGFLICLSYDLSSYSMSTMIDGFGTIIVDVIATTVVAAVVSAVIVLLWGKSQASE